MIHGILLGTSGNVFESREGPSSAFFENPNNLAPLSGRGRMRELQSSAIRTPRFNQGAAPLIPYCRSGGTCSLNGMMDYPKFQISEMHLGKFPDSMEFESWKVNFKTEVCPKSADPQLTMQWIKEVEIAKSIDDHDRFQVEQISPTTICLMR